MNELYLDGIKIDQAALADYIKYLKTLQKALQDEDAVMRQKYKNTHGWRDEGYQQLGSKLDSLGKDVTRLNESIARTIKSLEELYRRVEQYLIIVRRNRR